MCIYIRNFSSSTRCYKYATASIVVALVFYAVGFFTRYWTSSHVFNKVTFVERTTTVGIWRTCICVLVYKVSSCSCEEKRGDPGIFFLLCVRYFALILQNGQNLFSIQFTEMYNVNFSDISKKVLISVECHFK